MSLRTLLVTAAAAVLIGGCGASDDWSQPHPKPTAVGALGEGFVDARHPPAPEATIKPRAGSWDAVHPSQGYRVVLLTTNEDAATKQLNDAVAEWAEQVGASLKTVAAPDAGNLIPPITQAMRLSGDLIIATGNGLVDPLALVTANHLAQQFLVLGAELAEPTENVTAANWVGAAFRGEGLQMSSYYDPRTFTEERAERAVRAGVAAVLNDITGIVIRLD